MKKTIQWLFLFITIAMLSSCATIDSTKSEPIAAISKPMPPPMAAPAPKKEVLEISEIKMEHSVTVTSSHPSMVFSGAGIVSGSYSGSLKKPKVALREFVYRSQPLKGTNYNLVILNSKPLDEASLQKVMFICELWKDTVPDKETFIEIYGSNADVELIPFYWPLKKKANTDNCGELVMNYDYERVQLLVQSLKIKNKSPQFLYRTDKAIVTMDLSVISNKNDIGLAMETWRENMCLPFDKDTKINAIDLVQSMKRVLGILSNYLTVKI